MSRGTGKEAGITGAGRVIGAAMKRIQYHRYGGPGEMRLESFEPRLPQAGQVRVRVKTASLNPLDWKLRNGLMKFMTGDSFPRGMGTDFAGIVDAVGPGVPRFAVGDEVLGTVNPMEAGGFGEVVTTEENLLAKKPPALSFDQAACVPVAAVTAWRGLVDNAQLKAGQSVFVNGCTGGVGQAAVQLAKHFGASVAGSCGSDSVEIARRLGVDPLIDYTKQTAASLGRKFDVIFDTAGTMDLKDSRAMLEPGGVILDINMNPGKAPPDPLTPGYKAVFGTQTPDTLQTVAALASEGKIKFEIGRTALLDEAISLISDQEQGRRVHGKLVIHVNP